MSKLTAETIGGMTIAGVEEYLNARIANSTFTSEDASYVRNRAFDNITNSVSDLDCRLLTYTGTKFSIQFKGLEMNFSISVSKTGKTKKVTRLRSKDVVKVNKVKYTDSEITLLLPSFEWDDPSNMTVKVDTGWTHNKRIYLKKFDGTIADMVDPNGLRGFIEENSDKFGGRIEDIILQDMIQPFFKDIIFKLPRVAKYDIDAVVSLLPKGMLDILPKTDIDHSKMEKAARKLVRENNSELLDKVIDLVLTNKTHSLFS